MQILSIAERAVARSTTCLITWITCSSASAKKTELQRPVEGA